MHWYFWIAIVVAILCLIAMPQAKLYMAHRPIQGIFVIAIVGLLWPLSALALAITLIGVVVVAIGNLLKGHQ